MEGVTEVRRFARADIDDFVKNRTKAFTKEKCAECGSPATKRFAGMMPFIVGQMLDSYWCNECGRVLCQAHRYQHTCERLDQQKERNKTLTREQLAAQILEAEELEEARKAAVAEEERHRKEAWDDEVRLRKNRREIVAKKARKVEDFLQRYARDTDATAGLGPRVRDELLDIFSRVRSIALRLYNELEQPTMPGIDEESWEIVKADYARAREITGMFVMELDMRNPWDPDGQAEGGEDLGQ